MRSARPALLVVGAVCVHAVFAALVFAGLGAPLLWQDEGETAMFGRSVLANGYPKVHGPGRNIVYGVHHPIALGVREPLDAYVGSPWGQYYFAAPAVAWSDAADDLAGRTRRARLPFAAAGWLGVVLLGSVGASLWPMRAGGRAVFWLGFGACLAVSVSLQLHLREMRYYPLVVLGVAAVAWLEVRRHARGDLAPLRHTLLLAPVVWCLFNLFYPAFAAVAATAACAIALFALRSRAALAPRVLGAARAGAPYLLASGTVVPLAAFYGIAEQSRSFADAFGPESPAVGRIGAAVWYLVRFELAVPAVVGALGLGLASRRAGAVPRELRVLCDAVSVALGGAAIWTALVAATPLFFERYLVALSPVLAAATVLSIGGLVAMRETPARRRAACALAAVALALLGSAAARGPELRGRWIELREPYRGPLDYVIPYLAERRPDPAGLVIATNYEDFSYMFYLGATVTLGYYAPDPERDQAIPPDVIVPRPWPVNLRALERLAAQGGYTAREFPVANVRANNLPELSKNSAGLVHRFTSPVAGRDGPPLVIGERAP